MSEDITLRRGAKITSYLLGKGLIISRVQKELLTIQWPKDKYSNFKNGQYAQADCSHRKTNGQEIHFKNVQPHQSSGKYKSK